MIVFIQKLNEIHMKMETELEKKGAYLDDIFFCPHHPHKGYAGEVPELKIECECRKPKNRSHDDVGSEPGIIIEALTLGRLLMEKKINRIEWIDVAKGLLIVMVCLGHRNIPEPISKWIYSFHMPAFFFFAGYTTKNTATINFYQYFKKKIKGLLVPYFSLGIIYILVEYLCVKLYRGGVFDFERYVIHLLSGSGIGSSWFIIALFVTEIIAYWLHRFSKIQHYILAIVIGGIGFALSQILKKTVILECEYSLYWFAFF